MDREELGYMLRYMAQQCEDEKADVVTGVYMPGMVYLAIVNRENPFKSVTRMDYKMGVRCAAGLLIHCYGSLLDNNWDAEQAWLDVMKLLSDSIKELVEGN